MKEKFSFEKTLKTDPENDFLNLQSYLFITSKQLTRFFFSTKITPHQVILLSMVFGIAASILIIQDNTAQVILGTIMLFYKNVLDKVDGSLARAKGLDSRRGRFYDSISDFIVTLAAFGAMSYFLYMKYGSPLYIILGFTAMIFSMLQCSYFIYYQVSFIIQTGKNTVNRIDESITEADRIEQDRWTTFLQKVFLWIYGWQDKIVKYLDQYMFKKFASVHSLEAKPENIRNAWYENKPFLTLASSLSIGTHIFLICLSAVMRVFEYYFFVNLICMNLLLIYSIVFHFKSSKKQVLNG